MSRSPTQPNDRWLRYSSVCPVKLASTVDEKPMVHSRPQNPEDLRIALNQLAEILRTNQLSDQQRQSRSRDVRRHVLQNATHLNVENFHSISPQDLGLLFHSIDEFYFEGLVGRVCELSSAKPLAFRLSSRMTTSGGMTTMRRSSGNSNDVEYEIALATTPLFQTFQVDSEAMVGGIRCFNRFDATQRIMEHEIIHLIELLITGDSNCAKPAFRKFVNHFFGHLESNHQLLTPAEIARRQLGISPGDRVRFIHNAKQQVGFVNRISKRATVLVRSNAGVRYNDGQRYEKYYVPIHHLRRA
jgi:bifunctional DNA-binding transcriptional regulator/antitoxin component of YhaV-PrlF toxin-antitoxin module